MAEKKTAFLGVNIMYECETGDGGVLMYDENPKIDNQGGTVFLHRCSNPKDKTEYFLKSRYPREETVVLNLNLPGLIL